MTSDTNGKRLCNECKGQIDDEVHSLTECNKCDKLRKDLFDSLLASHPFTLRPDNKETFKELMTSNLNVLVAVGKSYIWHLNSNSKFHVYVDNA